MRTPTLFMSLLILLWTVSAPAKGIYEISQAVQQPIEIHAGKSPRMNVFFAHTVHKGIECGYCHHNVSATGRYVPCATCHCTPGARERAPISMFMAYHAKGNARSCLGCHMRFATDESKYSSKFRGCRPCHMSSETRQNIRNADVAQ